MAIGIICEYNPFHNGHIYHINQIKKKYPNETLILCLNGYFLERGEKSLLTKKEKAEIALTYGVDLVIELPVLYGTQAADAFAKCAMNLLASIKVNKIIFGSETNDPNYLTSLAQKQLNDNFKLSSEKTSYSARIGASLQTSQIFPNDILGICYIKEILKNNYDITYETIQRTNEYHDTKSCNSIVSASNIREKIKRNKTIQKYLPPLSYQFIHQEQEEKYFEFLKIKIITENHLEKYLDVTEGMEYKLKKEIQKVTHYEELIDHLKSKRYTYNHLHRMLLHIFLGILKEDAKTPLSYIRILGWNQKGKEYLKKEKKNFLLPTKIDRKSKIYQYEQTASICYDLLFNTSTFSDEIKNQPVTIGSNEEIQK